VSSASETAVQVAVEAVADETKKETEPVAEVKPAEPMETNESSVNPEESKPTDEAKNEPVQKDEVLLGSLLQNFPSYQVKYA